MEMIVALGANLGAREVTLNRAVKEIGKRIGSVKACSSIIETDPLVPAGTSRSGQPPYLNAVLTCESSLEPEAVLDILLQIEKELGRVRGVTDIKWGARTIDLDLIGVEHLVVNTKRLTLPHPEMHKRRFVLEPLQEVAPKWVHPVLRKTAEEMLDGAGVR